MSLFEIQKTESSEDAKYSKKIEVPQYLPSKEMPHISSLMNTEKYSKLIHSINNSTVSEEEKKFLKLAASRHIVFNYAKIADYYAHASKEMQELMEQSALVILDISFVVYTLYTMES